MRASGRSLRNTPPYVGQRAEIGRFGSNDVGVNKVHKTKELQHRVLLSLGSVTLGWEARLTTENTSLSCMRYLAEFGHCKNVGVPKLLKELGHRPLDRDVADTLKHPAEFERC